MVVLAFVTVMSVTLLVRGVTIDVFWDWFLIDPGAPFYGLLPPVTLAEALGVALVVTMFTFSMTGSDADATATEGQGSGTKLVTAILRAVFFYGFAWLFALVLKSWV